MKVSSRGFGSFAAVAAWVVLAACSGSESVDPLPSGPSLTLTGVGWYEESIDPGFWASPPPNGQTAFYDFLVQYSGDITYGDIQSARLYAPGGASYWNLAPDASYLDTTNRTIGGWRRWFGSTPNLLPIGSMRAEVTLRSGEVASASVFVPAPGSTAAGAYTTMHSEDLLSPPADSAPMIRRATMGTSTVAPASQTIGVAFSVDDARVYNGFVWFFDSIGTYAGGFCCFRDPSTGSIAPQLGGVLHTDGTANALTLAAGDLELAAGMTFDRIANARVVLVDGEQYAPQLDGQLRYDCRSIGPAASLAAR